MLYSLNPSILLESNDSELDGVLNQASLHLLDIIWRYCKKTIETSEDFISKKFVDKVDKNGKKIKETPREKEELENAKDFCFKRISKCEQIIYKIERQLEDRHFYERFQVL